MTMAKENFNKFNKKFIVTALGVAALGFQLMQTNNVKADDIADSKTGDVAQEQNTVDTKDSSVADDSSIQENASSQDVENTDQDDKDVSKEEKSASDDKLTDSENADSVKETEETLNDTVSQNDNDTQNTDKKEIDNEKTDKEETEDEDEANIDDHPQTVDDAGVMIQNPTKGNITNNYEDPIKTAASVTVTNSKGTATSDSTDDDIHASAIFSADSSVTLNYSITNTADENRSDFGTNILLPAYNNNGSITISKDADLTEAFKNVPDGVSITYDTTDGRNLAYDGKTDIDPSIIKQIYIDPKGVNLAPGQTIKISLPLTNTNTNKHQSNEASIGVYILNPHSRWENLHINYNSMDDAIKSSEFLGQYPAATVNDLNVSYTDADQEIQSQMPNYTGGSDIQIDNFSHTYVYDHATDHRVDADKADLLLGGTIYVNLVDSGITKIANNDGYSVLLNTDGSQQTEYNYLYSQRGVTVSSNPDNQSSGSATGEATKKVSSVYISLRHVINAKNSTTKVGQNWTESDNLTSVQDNDDNVLTGNEAINAVSTSINDKDGILKDGKVTKAGSFDITYTYYLKDGTAITKTVTVTANSVPSSSNHSSSHNSSTNSDFTDPMVSPDSPDNINDNEKLVSTHPADGVVSLYKLDTSKVTNRSLNTASDWYSDKDMTFAGDTYYRVATNEWVKASNVYVYADRNLVIQTNSNQQLVDSKGNAVTNRSLLANTSWYTDRVATINGKSYYRVATNEFVPTDAVTVM